MSDQNPDTPRPETRPDHQDTTLEERSWTTLRLRVADGDGAVELDVLGALEAGTGPVVRIPLSHESGEWVELRHGCRAILGGPVVVPRRLCDPMPAAAVERTVERTRAAAFGVQGAEALLEQQYIAPSPEERLGVAIAQARAYGLRAGLADLPDEQDRWDDLLAILAPEQ